MWGCSQCSYVQAIDEVWVTLHSSPLIDAGIEPAGWAAGPACKALRVHVRVLLGVLLVGSARGDRKRDSVLRARVSSVMGRHLLIVRAPSVPCKRRRAFETHGGSHLPCHHVVERTRC